MGATIASTNRVLMDLERELEADLTEAQRHIELGRRNAIDELNRHRESLGELFGEATLHIDLLAYDANDDLKRVRSQLGELHELLLGREVKDLPTFDRFCESFIDAMASAERDLNTLNQCGDEWGGREQRIRDAWQALSRQLELARLHLMHEARIAKAELEGERAEFANQLEKQDPVDAAVRVEQPTRQAGEILVRAGSRIGKWIPKFWRVAPKDQSHPPGGRRHD